MFRIKHIFHSGFQIEWEDKFILIDVFNQFDYVGKKIYYFSTHSHGDHFNVEAGDLSKENEVTYILSDDISVDYGIKVKDGDKLELDGMIIEVFGTTDLGVSFYIEYLGKTIFHSGDLNWWDWKNQTQDERLEEKRIYFKEIKRLKDLKVDYAFVPVDPRLESSNRLAMDHFIDQVHPKYLIPMHFGDAFDSIENLETHTETEILKAKERNTYIL